MSKVKKKLTTNEKLEIINDDPILWLKNFVKIIDNEGQEVPFVLNKEQEDFVNNMGKYNIICKARQIGFTTMSLGLMLYYACTLPHTNYLMLSYDGESVQNIFSRLKMMYESIPYKYQVKQRRMNKMELLLENGSRISVKVAGNKELGRSFTCQMIHLSEFAFWEEKQQSKGLLALEQSLAKNPNSKIIIESTSNGIGNNYYNLFTSAYKNNSKYKTFFYNWYQNKTQFKSDYDQAETWYKSECHGVRLAPDDLTPYEKDLYDKGATLKQLMWRQWKLLDMTLDEFNQEFPSTPEESFVTTSTGVFDAAIITSRYNYLPQPLKYNEIKPLPESLIKYFGKGLFIYKNVKRGERYFGGIDTGAGLKGDYSSIVVLDSSGEQVAVFNRNDVPVYKFAKIAYDLGMYFNYAMYLPERNSYGLDLITRLRKEQGYINVLKIKKFDKIRGQKIYEYGWYTDNVSKNKLIMDLKEAFETGIILVNSRDTLDEMRIYVEDDGKMGNIKGGGNHDDLVDSLALAVQSLKANKWYL